MQEKELSRWRQLEPSQIQDRLRLSPAEIQRWTGASDRHASADVGSVTLPADPAAADLIVQLGMDRVDVPGFLATRPDERGDPELYWLLDRCCRWLIDRMGRPDPAYRGWPRIDAGPVGGFVYAWAFLAVLPAVRRYHASVGISEVESWDSLSVLGREIRDSHTGPGLGPTWMLPLVFSGVSFRLGRLAFDQRAPAPDGHPVLIPGEGSWNIHVPNDGGPITPKVCTASMERAVELSRRLSQTAVVFCCHSWLMEPQLLDHLSADSNIVQFQSRFHHFTDEQIADADPIHYVFGHELEGVGDRAAFLDQLPQQTSLQRTIIAVLRSGNHWHTRTGWSRTARPDTGSREADQ
jgi:hypothetical protein